MKYCFHTGSFKLYRSLSCSSTSLDTALSASKGPPGAECTIKKVTVITTSSTGRAVKNLRKIKLIKLISY